MIIKKTFFRQNFWRQPFLRQHVKDIVLKTTFLIQYFLEKVFKTTFFEDNFYYICLVLLQKVTLRDKSESWHKELPLYLHNISYVHSSLVYTIIYNLVVILWKARILKNSHGDIYLWQILNTFQFTINVDTYVSIRDVLNPYCFCQAQSQVANAAAIGLTGYYYHCEFCDTFSSCAKTRASMWVFSKPFEFP